MLPPLHSQGKHCKPANSAILLRRKEQWLMCEQLSPKYLHCEIPFFAMYSIKNRAEIEFKQHLDYQLLGS